MDIQQHAPKPYAAMIRLNREVAAAGLDRRLHELVRLRVSQLNGCAYCVDMHSKDARAAGETEQRLYAVSAWREAPFFTERERIALAFAEALTRPEDHRGLEKARDAAERAFGAELFAALVFAIAEINAWNAIGVGASLEAGTYEPQAAAAA